MFILVRGQRVILSGGIAGLIASAEQFVKQDSHRYGSGGVNWRALALRKTGYGTTEAEQHGRLISEHVQERLRLPFGLAPLCIDILFPPCTYCGHFKHK